MIPVIKKKKVISSTLLLFLVIFFCHVGVGFPFLSSPSRYSYSPVLRPCFLSKMTIDASISTSSTDDNLDDGSWSVSGDNWESISDTSSVTDQENISEFTNEMTDDTVSPQIIQISEEDNWIQDDVDEIIDEIHNAYSTLDVNLYDTSFDEPSKVDNRIKESIENDMDDEIAMLIRCNERPTSLLIEEGRAIAPLTKEEKDDVSQLVVLNMDTYEATKFLKDAVSKIFSEHAIHSVIDGVLSMDRTCIASWMTKSLREEGKSKVSPHDKRVLKTLSDFSTYGSGRLVEIDLQRLYLSCIVGDIPNLSSVSLKRHLEFRKSFRDVVWRDIRAHGIMSPIEEERWLLSEELLARDTELTVNASNKSSNKRVDQMFMDECEILDWDYNEPEQKSSIGRRGETTSSNSHKSVEMASDQKTPLRMRGGDFVFIDEESCIGCIQCATIASSSFSMLDSGRARTFSQKTGKDVASAVEACPVSCMHRVSYQQLKELETVRDEGDGRTDHRHLGHSRGHIPLHVAGMDSDVNRRSSWYHTLKEKCVQTGCKAGCYDCPSYPPGEHPIFIQKSKQAEHIRAQDFIDNGDADMYRKIEDL